MTDQGSICIIHKKIGNLVCVISECQQRFLCEECRTEAHFKSHRDCIFEIDEFLRSQNKLKKDLVLKIDEDLIQVEKRLRTYEDFLLKTKNIIDKDFEELMNFYLDIANHARGFLKKNIYTDFNELGSKYVNERKNLQNLKNLIFQNEKKDFVFNFQKESLKEKVDRLILKNSDINLTIHSINLLIRECDNVFLDKVSYKPNEKSASLFKELKVFLSNFLVKFFKKFKVLLIRQSLEQNFENQFELLKQKLAKEFNFKNESNNNQLSFAKETTGSLNNISANLSLLGNMNNVSILSLVNEQKILEEKDLELPDYVIKINQKFEEFKPLITNNPKFVNLTNKQGVKLENGSIYEGEWDENMNRTGRGKCLFANGLFYDGYWIDGSPELLGRFIKPNYELYEGFIKKGNAEGKGVLITYDENYKYVGFWKENMKHGIGEENYKEKGLYKGEFMFNKHQGKGILKLPNGSYYEGDFFEGKFNGKGKFVWETGESFEGDWIDDKKHGKGRYLYHDGRIYEGDFCDDIPHGFGKLFYPDGTIIESFWKKGNPISLDFGQDKHMKLLLVRNSKTDTTGIDIEKDISLSND